jgi:integrase
MRVPADLQERLGVLEVRRSLKVQSAPKAQALALRYAVRLKDLFEMIRTTDLSKADIVALVQACFADLVVQAEGRTPPKSHDPDMELAWLAHLADEYERDLQRQIRRHQYDPDVVMHAKRLLEAHGVDLDVLPPAVREDLLEGLARGMAEQQRLHLVRLNDRLVPYAPTDPLFHDPVGKPVGAASSTDQRPLARIEPSVGPTTGEAVETYLQSKRRSCTAKTHVSRSRHLSYLTEHLGCDTPMADVTIQQVGEFRDALERLRSNHHVGAGKSFVSRQTNDLETRITPKTASLILDSAKAFFRWSARRYLGDKNPAASITIEMPKALKSKKSRRPFTGEELECLFSAPLFTGCKAPRRRFEPGEWVIQDARYWIPLLGFFTGMRLGEIVQLHLRDAYVDGPIPYLDVTDDESGEIGSGTEKHIKTNAGIRMIPLHPQLIELGFADFVRSRRGAKRTDTRLFWEVAFGQDGQASTVYSKWFARLLDKVGLTDPKLVFHSLRHNAEDALRNALLHREVVDGIMGHEVPGEGSTYGDGVSLETAYSAIKAMKLKVRFEDGTVRSSPPTISAGTGGEVAN